VDEFKQEMQHMRRAQMKVREAAGTAGALYGGHIGSLAPFPPGIPSGVPPMKQEKELLSKFEDDSKQAVQDDLDQINRLLSEAKRSKEDGLPLASATHPPGAVKPIQLQYNFYTQTKSTPKRQFKSGATLRSGDQLKVSFVPDRPGYVYVINFDPLGNANVIFPHPNIKVGNEVKAGELYELPPDDWYYLDSTKGKESIYLVASPIKINNLDDLISNVQEKGDVKSKSLSNARMRGVLVGLTHGKSYLSENGLTAVKVDFNHE
jgi:hypothetical protein